MDEIEIVSGPDAIAGLRDCWREAGANGLGAFDGFDFTLAAARAVHDAGSDPLVAVVRSGGRMQTLLPLRRERHMGARTIVPLVYPLAQYADVIGRPMAEAHLSRLSRELYRFGADLILLRKVRADSGLHPPLASEALSQRAQETALYIDLAHFGSFDAYEASYSRKTARARRQRRQKMEAEVGAISFSILTGPEAVPHFETAVAWKRDWLAKRGVSSSVFDGGTWQRLLAGTVESGDAIVSVLRAGERPAAIEVGFRDRATYVSYLGSFDPAFGAYSPGQLQMLATIEWAFTQGFTRYDLLAPADDYKRQWVRGDTGVAIDDYAIALTAIGRGVAEIRRHVRPLARDLYLKLSPEARVAGGRFGVPAAAAAAAAVCAGAVIAAIE